MARSSKYMKRFIHRFIFSTVVGFALGIVFYANSNNSILISLETFQCRSYLLHHRSLETQVGKTSLKKLQPQDGILYIGIMSTNSNMNSRVAAILDTWARHPKVKVQIFANIKQGSSTGDGSVKMVRNGVSVVSLPGVADNSYPPQRKSFSMFKFIHDNYLEKYHWFLRADDDAYIKIEDLLQYLNKLNSSEVFFLGHPGYGKHAEDYLFGENYCMGGPGVVMSRETLRQVGPKLAECIRHMYTEHEDIELGRCVRNVTGVGCSSAWETSSVFYQNFVRERSYGDNIEDISEQARAVGLTFHANKDPVHQYKLHVSILSDQISHLLLKITRTETESKKMTNLLANRKFDNRAWNSHGENIWDVITQRTMYSAVSAPVRSISAPVAESAARNLNITISYLCEQHKIICSHVDEIVMTHTKYHVNPFTSADMIANLKLRLIDDMTKKYLYIRNVYFRRSFPEIITYMNEPYDIKIQSIGDNVRERDSKRPSTGIVIGHTGRINFVMALSGRPGNLKRFLMNFDNAFLSTGENVSLTIVYYPQHPTGPNQEADQMINVDEKYPNTNINSSVLSDIDFVLLHLGGLSEKYPKVPLHLFPVKNGLPFSRGAGLQIGAESILLDEIIYFCDVDLVFRSEILYHIRRSTIRGEQVYYPTFFSQYDPEIMYLYRDESNTSFYYEEIDGFWRAFSYGMVAMYKSDFLKTGGFDLSIRGWGLEDVKMCDAVLQKAKLRIFRANEPAMVHIYHAKDCPQDLAPAQRKACQNSRAQHNAPQTLMYYLWQTGNAVAQRNEEERVERGDLSRGTCN